MKYESNLEKISEGIKKLVEKDIKTYKRAVMCDYSV